MEKINVAEILKDCPQGMELDCVMYENVYFDKISDDKKAYYPILCYITDEKGNRNSISFTKNGCESMRYGAKCVIFPKGKTTWEGFQRPFKDGDVIITGAGRENECVAIFKNDRVYEGNNSFNYHALIYLHTTKKVFKKDDWATYIKVKLATEEEKEKLFQAIKDNGYKWNAETKTLEKLVEPKFKVGDRVRHKNNHNVVFTITSIEEEDYYACGVATAFWFDDQDDYELVPNKFDITTLKPFKSKVLVRSSMDGLWKPAVFGFRNGYNDNAFYIVGGSCWKQCIPYLNNEHLCGTTNDCDEYYKTWK